MKSELGLSVKANGGPVEGHAPSTPDDLGVCALEDLLRRRSVAMATGATSGQTLTRPRPTAERLTRILHVCRLAVVARR